MQSLTSEEMMLSGGSLLDEICGRRFGCLAFSATLAVTAGLLSGGLAASAAGWLGAAACESICFDYNG